MAIEFDILSITPSADDSGFDVEGMWIEVDRKLVSDANGSELRSFVSSRGPIEKKLVSGKNRDHSFCKAEIEKSKPLKI